MKKIFTILIFSVLLLSVGLVSADGDHQAIAEEGKNLVESNVDCDELTNEQLETIGEYFMEQMHPGESHEALHEMMGIEEGTEYHEQFHVNIARMMYCGENGMMGGGMMNMMGGQTPQTNMMHEMMGNWGYGFGYWNFINVLYVILLIGLIILVYLWIVNLWRNMQNKRSKK